MKKKSVPENVDEDGVVYQVSSTLSDDGRFELPDSVPMEPPLGYRAPPDLTTMIKTMVRNELFMQEVARAGYETFEESDDFDIEDDPVDPLTPYEKVFEPPAKPPEEKAAGVSPGEQAHRAAPPVDASKPVVERGPESVVSVASSSGDIVKKEGEGG